MASAGIAALVVASLATGAVAAPSTGPKADNGLGKHDRELLASATAHGDKTVTLIVSTTPTSTSKAAAGLASLGGKVGYRDDALGYLRVTIATSKANQVTSVSGVEAVDVDEIVPLGDPATTGQQGPLPQAPPTAATPAVNPYMPIGDTGAAQFRAAHPTWDGRGTTIGIIDSGIDLAHPALQTTTTGERKVIDWVTATDPTFTNGVNNDDDPTWLDMSTLVSGSSFTVNGSTYTAPAAGSYRFGVFNERDGRLGGEVGSDVNRDGNPAGSSGLFAVLWDAKAGTVWVDTDQDGSFADQSAMRDYKVAKDVGTFGTDNPATAIVEQMPFVVQTDGKNKVVNIGIVSAAHGSHVAGITAANGMFGGAMTGAAPGAKLVSVRVCMFVVGCTNHALLEGMIYAAKTANVDVINMSIGGLPALNDGNNARAALYDKLITQSNVQIFISAGNSGAGLNTIGDPSVASKVLSIGSYISKDTWLSNYGSEVSAADNMHPFSSRGPREDGGFKPEIIAPGSAVSTIPTWQNPAGQCLPYACPVGYAMFNGTSMASPQAAGAAALLVSAAKQTGVQSQPDQLRKAITSSAHQIAGYGSYEQGNGLMAVGDAWNLLKTNAKTVTISSSVPVNTVLSGFLATPGRGQGIYDREGVKAGDSYVRSYTFTRTNGGGGTKAYAVNWVGNDGTFSSAGSISLPLGVAVQLPVTIHPTTSGIHSAILNLDDPTSAGVEKQTLNTVVAADQFTAANSYTVTKSGTLGRDTSVSYFVNVPVGAPALKIDLAGGGAAPGAGQIRFLRFHPYGVGLENNSTPNSYNPPVPGCSENCTVAAATSRTTSNPFPGVWEIVVEVRRTSDADPVPYTLTAAILGATVTPNPDTIASASIGVPVARSYTATNLFGEFTGRMVGTSLGSAKRTVESIANSAQKQILINVTPGSTSLRATIGSTSDLAADLDLFVYNCTTGSCVLAGQSADGDSEESVTIANPAAGTWVALVDGYAVPAGTTTFKYEDVFANPVFGAVSVTDANALRPAGSSWTVPGTITANSAPAAGRFLLGSVQVRTNTNVLVGFGDVVVQSVTP
ncbi:S8 family serine peptidase [Janibacter sp. HTCC2649]|uniref:S8 family serine peptidase n=1 Tax=Janibacter sp. HTCC2649 TaxID=313589 RepID=UPI0005937C33|nr:S8 family serine peptidase [Janibacter sp. HTCC2649]